ncbi:SH3 domain-binding glutamic acid-rich-like protein 3 [Electrophorus electricus]|uniref:SH3 domain-binding glutamic acid-rich-like protein n=1 Tax=Electrophorus electricus TaxID=8005 RepID=A0AAY5EX51_ELEEL|nr:SH3 domain-binding glutamic acid-rich-like protein 3 [Electrophorus electricus]
MSILIYFSSAGGSREVKQQQQQIFQFLESKMIKYRTVDITQDPSMKEEMRKKVGSPTAMPPQVFSGDMYCGDFQAFFQAVEEEKGEAFFKL